MLIDLALGTVPSNLTVPRMAVALGLVVDGAPAFTICRLEIEMVRTRAIAANKVLYFILHLEEAYASKVCVSVSRARLFGLARGWNSTAGERPAISFLIAGGDYKHPEQDGPNLAFTNDGGLTWTLSPISPQRYWSAVAFAKPHSDSEAIVIVGSSGAAYKDDIAKAPGPKTSSQKTSLQKTSQKIWDSNLNAVSVSSSEIIAVGPKGLIVNLPPAR